MTGIAPEFNALLQGLLSTAEQAGIELLVTGAFEGSALNRRRFLSSVARKLVESARCSLLLGRSQETEIYAR